MWYVIDNKILYSFLSVTCVLRTEKHDEITMVLRLTTKPLRVRKQFLFPVESVCWNARHACQRIREGTSQEPRSGARHLMPPFASSPANFTAPIGAYGEIQHESFAFNPLINSAELATDDDVRMRLTLIGFLF